MLVLELPDRQRLFFLDPREECRERLGVDYNCFPEQKCQREKVQNNGSSRGIKTQQSSDMCLSHCVSQGKNVQWN